MNIPTEAIRKELAPGERLLWSGSPVRGLRFENADLSKSGFGLIFFSFAAFWIHGVWSQSSAANSAQSPLFALFGVPFVLIGFYLLVGHFFWSALCRKRTEYAVTNQRVIVRSGIFSTTTKSIEYRKIPTLTLTEKSDASGTIQFGETKADHSGDAVSYAASKMEAVPDVRVVHHIIRKASATPA
ncbi:MAG: PH domain-containing protein [Rhizobiales bacterium]|nr:PH domain-containing protein [Hyphomicrobiales bacterium]